LFFPWARIEWIRFLQSFSFFIIPFSLSLIESQKESFEGLGIRAQAKKIFSLFK